MGGTGDITSDRLRPLSGLTAVEVGGGWPALLLSKLLYDQGMSILRVSGDIEIPPENRICPMAAKAIAAHFRCLLSI